ncbi:MAG: hypothetical protein OXI90_10250 [Gammaproteobacteria bacterium]|nr:hypothetical protein [Gammaproteobacteria bacterium]
MQRLLASAICLILTASSHAERFTFVALGDTAYDAARDQPIYEALIETINRSKPAFTIHVGDVWGLDHCGNDEIQEVAETFRLFDHSLVYVPGDNEWTDCHYRLAGAFDPAERLAQLRKVFFSKPVSLGATPMPLISQGRISPYAKYTENVRWQKGGVLFFTMNVTGSGNGYRYDDRNALLEAQERNAANVAWLRDSFRIARENAYKGVVIAVHAEMLWGESNQAFRGPHGIILREIRIAAERYGGPVLLVHGDSHEFVVDRPFIES